MAEYQYPTPNVKALTFSEAIYNLMEAGHLLRQHVTPLSTNTTLELLEVGMDFPSTLLKDGQVFTEPLNVKMSSILTAIPFQAKLIYEWMKRPLDSEIYIGIADRAQYHEWLYHPSDRSITDPGVEKRVSYFGVKIANSQAYIASNMRQLAKALDVFSCMADDYTAMSRTFELLATKTDIPAKPTSPFIVIQGKP